MGARTTTIPAAGPATKPETRCIIPLTADLEPFREDRTMTAVHRGLLAVACLGLGLTAGLVAQPPAAAPPPPLPKELASFSPVVKRVLPAVVSIEGKGKAAKAAAKDDADPGFGSGV